MLRIPLLGCLLGLVGCVGSDPAASITNRSITSVTWDASHQPVVKTRQAHVVNRSSSVPDSIVADPGCAAGDLIISDKPPIVYGSGTAGGAGYNAIVIDPSSNVLCITPPGDTESISLKTFPYAPNPSTSWAYHVLAFWPGTQTGGFFNDGTDNVPRTPCDSPFNHAFYNAVDAAGTCAAIANAVEFDTLDAAAICTGSLFRCAGSELQHCDGWGQWQNSLDCSATYCDASAKGCCQAPTCAAGTCGSKSNACGTVNCGECEGSNQTCVNNVCKVVACHCPKGSTCDPDGACIKI